MLLIACSSTFADAAVLWQGATLGLGLDHGSVLQINSRLAGISCGFVIRLGLPRR